MGNKAGLFINRTELKLIHSLLIGCGGTGTRAVNHCRNLVLQEWFGNDEVALNDFGPLQFVALDSVRQETGRHSLETIEIAARDQNELEAVIDDESKPTAGERPVAILRDMPRRNYKRMLNTLPGPSMGNSTCPPLGAINFLTTWPETRKTLKDRLLRLKRPHTLDPAKFMPLERQNQIFVVASLYGGTGSGVHLHLAAMLRDMIKDLDLQLTNTAIYGIFFLPDVVSNADDAGKLKLRSNTYACLRELDHFMAGNPYRLRLGSRELIVRNTGTDYLFNKIFLLNEQNIEGVTLRREEVLEMAGEFLFHMTATRLGEDVSARLVDTPTERCIQTAPLGKGRQEPGEQRICAYASFGLATVRIPYEILRHNQQVDFAREVMNALMLVPDDDSAAERRLVEERRQRLRSQTFAMEGLLRTLDLEKNRLEAPFRKKQGGLSFAGSSRIQDYMKRMGIKNLDEAFRRIQDDTRGLLENLNTVENNELIQARLSIFEPELEKNAQEIEKQGGQKLAIVILEDLLKHITKTAGDYWQEPQRGGRTAEKADEQPREVSGPDPTAVIDRQPREKVQCGPGSDKDRGQECVGSAHRGKPHALPGGSGKAGGLRERGPAADGQTVCQDSGPDQHKIQALPGFEPPGHPDQQGAA